MSSLIPICCSWLVGLWCSPWLGAAPKPWCYVLGLTLSATIALRSTSGPNHHRRSRRVLVVLAGVAGLCRTVQGAPAHLSPAAIPAGLARVTGQVEHSQRTASGEYRQQVRIECGSLRADDSPLPAPFLITVGPYRMPEGARIEALVTLSPWTPYRNPSPHPQWSGPRVIHASARLPSESAFRIIETAPLTAALGAMRHQVRRMLYASLPPHHAGWAAALTLGDRLALERTQRDAMAQAGLAHLLAVSGLHVTLIAGICVGLLTRIGLWLPWLSKRWEAKRLACGASVLPALSLGTLCGGAPSARRAALTVALSFTLIAVGRRPDSGAITAAAVLLLTALQPEWSRDAAFLLSVTATTALLQPVTEPHMRFSAPRSRLQRWVRDSVRTSYRSTVATTPIILWCFGQVPVVGLVSNLLAVPLVSFVLLPMCLLHTFCAQAASALVPLTGTVLGGAIDLLTAMPALFTSWIPPWNLPPLSTTQGLLITLAAAALLLSRTNRTRLICLALVGLGMVIAEWKLRADEAPHGTLRVTFVDVGQGDAALVDLPDGQLMLIDAGGDPIGAQNPGAAALLPLLEARRRNTVDIALITHPHPDHYGGFDALHDRIAIRELWDSGQAFAERDITATGQALAMRLDRWAEAGTKIVTPPTLCSSARTAGGAQIRILWPCPTADSVRSENDNSLVLLIEYGQTRVLFAGDLEQESERLLTAQTRLTPVDVLKVGHHGSNTSTTSEWLQRLQPQVAVISRGTHNRFGHPHPEVLSRLQQSGAHVVDLATAGGTIMTTDGHELTLHSWSEQRIRLSAHRAPELHPLESKSPPHRGELR